MTPGVVYGNFKTIGIRVALESHTEVEPIFYFECQKAWQDSRPGGHTIAIRLLNKHNQALAIGGAAPDSWHGSHWSNDLEFHKTADYGAAKAQLLNSGIQQKAPGCLAEIYIDDLFSTNIRDHVMPDNPNAIYVGPIAPGVIDNRSNKLSVNLDTMDSSLLL